MADPKGDCPLDANKVLVAEDNPVVRKGLVNFINKWGYEPVEVDNGDVAWKKLENDHSIRLAIVDWNLPGLSGMQVCQRLRLTTEMPYVYAIMFTSRKSKEEEILALDGGADDYLIKPCKPSELRARLGVGKRIIESALQNKQVVDEIDKKEADPKSEDDKANNEEKREDKKS